MPETAAKAVGKPLKSIELPRNTIFAVVQRDGEVFVPGAESTIERGDTVIIIAPETMQKTLGRVFTA